MCENCNSTRPVHRNGEVDGIQTGPGTNWTRSIFELIPDVVGLIDCQETNLEGPSFYYWCDGGSHHPTCIHHPECTTEPDAKAWHMSFECESFERKYGPLVSDDMGGWVKLHVDRPSPDCYDGND